MTSPHGIVNAARSMLNTPFVHQGRLPGVGLDCVGVVALACERAGVPLMRVPSDYPRIPRASSVRELVLASAPDEGCQQAGTIAVIAKRMRRKHARHVGILSSSSSVIHASGTSIPPRVVEESIVAWEIISVHLVPGVEYGAVEVWA
jgi:cell wall-associated NlpC family hydrolase